MHLPLVHLLGLVVVVVLAGNELGSRFVVHPALDALPASVRIPAEQALYRRYGRVMPVMMIVAVAAPLALLLGLPDRTSPAVLPTLASFVCLLAMLAITLRGNVPLNRRILDFDPGRGTESFDHLRARWDRLHTARVALDTAGFVLLCLGAVSRIGG